MKQKLNWAIVGSGNIANDFAQQFDSTAANLVSVVSRSPEKSQQFAASHNIPMSHADFDALIDDPQIDVIYIATPHNSHYPFIYQALSKHKHVVCEKVITLNNRQLTQLVELAQANKVYLFEAMTIHYMPVYADIKNWITSQDLGPLKMIQANFGSFKGYDERYYFDKTLAGGALFDIGVYALNFVRFFLSEQPHEVLTTAYINEFGVDESSVIALKNSANELATVSLTFRAKMPKVGILAYEHGYFTFTDYPSADTVTFTSTDGQQQSFNKGDASQRLAYEVRTISDIINNNAPNPYISYTQDVLAIMDKVRDTWGLSYDNEETFN